MWVELLEQVEDYSFADTFRIERVKLRYRRFDGRMSEEITRINFERGDSAGVLLYDPVEDIIKLVRQFRYPVYASLAHKISKEGDAKQAWLLEIVAGTIEPGQNAVQTASKELLEEAGWVVKGDLQPIVTIYPSPGGASERIFLFLGLISQMDRLEGRSGLSSEGEDIRVVSLVFDQAMDMISRGEISDAKTIIALQHLALLKSSGVKF